jgi:ABC-type dipeptide/oligopeptide/nickel transport system permease subunit
MGLVPQEPELGRMISEGWRSGGRWLFPALALVYIPFLWLTMADRVLGLLKVKERSGWVW